MTIPKLHPNLKEFLCCLSDHRVRFVVLGGHVLATLGRPRYTDDLDVLVEPTKANAARLAKALDAFGYTELAAQTKAHFSQLDRMATLGRPPVAIDILSSTPGSTSTRRGKAVSGYRSPDDPSGSSASPSSWRRNERAVARRISSTSSFCAKQGSWRPKKRPRGSGRRRSDVLANSGMC